MFVKSSRHFFKVDIHAISVQHSAHRLREQKSLSTRARYHHTKPSSPVVFSRKCKVFKRENHFLDLGTKRVKKNSSVTSLSQLSSQFLHVPSISTFSALTLRWMFAFYVAICSSVCFFIVLSFQFMAVYSFVAFPVDLRFLFTIHKAWLSLLSFEAHFVLLLFFQA